MGYIISLCKFAPLQSMKSYAGMALQLHWFLTQVLDVGECSHICRFTPAEVSTSARRKAERGSEPQSQSGRFIEENNHLSVPGKVSRFLGPAPGCFVDMRIALSWPLILCISFQRVRKIAKDDF
jgi:hypothetical protein